MIHASAVDTVGNTPLVELSRLIRGLPARILGKLEMRIARGAPGPSRQRSDVR
jgi:cysteine synthase